MQRPEKAKKVEELTEVFNEARSVVLNDFTGLNVEKISELRKLCRENGVEYLVVKNRLAKRGIKGTPGEGLEEHFEGPTALAFSRESENMSAKILADFAKDLFGGRVNKKYSMVKPNGHNPIRYAAEYSVAVDA